MIIILNFKLKDKEFYTKIFCKEDIEEILSFQDIICSDIKDKNQYVAITKDEYLYALEGNGIVMGAYCGEVLAGIWLVQYFGQNKDNLGYDLGYSKEELEHTANLESTIVSKDFRGYGLNKKVIGIILDNAKKSIDTFACTVATYNLPSMKAILDNDFCIKKFKIKYTHKERYIFVKQKKKNYIFDELSKKEVDYKNKQCIINLLNSGYIGKYINERGELELYREIPFNNKIGKKFYLGKTLDVAKELIGCYLVHKTKDGITCARIVETEAYLGKEDMACHSYNKSPFGRTNVMYEDGSLCYVYLIYGMYYCFNVVTEEKDKPEAVLIRAGEPVYNIELMKRRRKTTKLKNLLSGPGKFCMGLGITKEDYAKDLTKDEIFIVRGNILEGDILPTKRINIDYSGEAKDYLYRFILKKSEYLSVKNKQS